MLNLKDLEKKLDDALSNETEESLLKWLLKKRVNSVQFLGAGLYEELKPSNSVIKPCLHKTPSEFKSTKGHANVVDAEYAIAA